MKEQYFLFARNITAFFFSNFEIFHKNICQIERLLLLCIFDCMTAMTFRRRREENFFGTKRLYLFYFFSLLPLLQETIHITAV